MSERALSDSAMDAMQEAVAWHTVGIVGNQGTMVGAGIGTGTAVKWRDHALILTAKHVIVDSQPSNLWFFFRPEGPLVCAEQSEIGTRRDTKFHLRQSLDIISVRYSASEDLSCIEVPMELESARPIRFFEIELNWMEPDGNDELLTMGYPSDLKREVSGGAYGVFSSVESTGFVPVENERASFLKDFDAERHFAVKYHSADMRNPHGFSGAGVWCHSGPTKVWHPNLRVCGIVASYYRSSQLLVGIRASRALRFLNEQYPISPTARTPSILG